MSTDAATLCPDPARLPEDVCALKELVAQLYGTICERERRIRQLEQHLHLLVKRFLRPASEKIDPRQLALFAVAEPAEGVTELACESLATDDVPPNDQAPDSKPAGQKTPHGRRRTPDTLEHREVVHDLTPEQRLALGGEQNLVYIGEDVTSNYEWTPSSVVVVKHHQKKYARREMEHNPLQGQIIVAPKPPSVIPGGAAGPGLLAQVIVSKYGDHLPLYRLERIFARQGVHFSRQTMCDWCAGCARALSPLTDLIREMVLASFVIHTDDTPVDVRDAHTKQKFQGRFWTYLGDEEHRLTWFDFTTSRRRSGPDRVLAGYRGYLQADGYGGYDDYEGVCLGEGSPILKVACWAHARRKFHDALRTELMPAQIALARIGQLYNLEKELRQKAASEWKDLPLEVRAALLAAERQARAGPILDDFHKWLEEQQQIALPKSPIAVAVRYALNQWSALRRYVDDGRLSIDNNAAERALRGIAIGRKNWLFCGSENGGRTAAVLFTMIASAVRNKLDPWAYLRDVLTRLPVLGEHPSREALQELLPDRWKPLPSDDTAATRP